ncbi:MAG TPA: tRNA pseudouridine(55) synthase TruB [Tepidisphaeraceae bacterium]|nr:tRNA pseudouridine(55) synthase TruB [Tepidisphaeraceae bacterium]
MDNETPLSGVINLDKSAGMSSALAVKRVKRLLLRKTKVGHAGTLDPFATGVLVILVGKATRLAERFMSEPKQYETTIKLGATTETLDPASAEIITPDAKPASQERVLEALQKFVGEIDQMPPVYSALKIAGQSAYKLARRGHEVKLESRKVRVYGIELMDYQWPLLQIRIDCGRGTYIRSIARDVGEALGVGGYLTALRRTRVGDCRAEQAAQIEDLEKNGIDRYLQSAEC